MPNYPRPKSSMGKKPTKSSLHPHGFPSFSETMEGLKEGLMNLGAHLVGAGAGLVGNLVGSLTNLKKSAQEGDEDAEKAYQEALAMLRGSGTSSAESILRDLGEEPGEAEGSEETSRNMEESGTAGMDFELTQELTEEPEEAPEEAKPTPTPDTSIHSDKIICLECGAEFKRLTQSHLAKHGMSLREYEKKYGSSGAATNRTGVVRKHAA